MKDNFNKMKLNYIEEKILESISNIIDPQDISNEEFDKLYKEIIRSSQKEIEDATIASYHELAPDLLKEKRRSAKEFEERSFSRWRPAFDHLEMMLSIAGELGQMHTAEFGEEECEVNGATMAALAHIFPRALLVTHEIICLLKGGFPDGALARWRSLHELCVTAMYIAKHGDVSAKQYIFSFDFSARRAAKQVNDYADRANLEKFSDDEMAAFDAKCIVAEAAIGRSITTDSLGEWPKVTQTHTTFSDIEKDVGMDHWRPRYKWASTHTHANHKPIGTLLGMAESTDFAHLAGPSNSGFVDPFIMTSISLSQITSAFILVNPNIDRIIHAKTMLRMADEMQEIAVSTERTTREAFDKAGNETDGF